MTNIIVSGGCVVTGSEVKDSVLFSDVRIHSGCRILQAVLMPGVSVGEGCRLTRVIVDIDCRLPAGLIVGEDESEDASRFQRSPSGVVLITQAMLDELRATPSSDG